MSSWIDDWNQNIDTWELLESYFPIKTFQNIISIHDLEYSHLQKEIWIFQIIILQSFTFILLLSLILSVSSIKRFTFSFRSCDLTLSNSLYTWSFFIEVKYYNIMAYVQFPKNDILKSIKLDLLIGVVTMSKCISELKRKKILILIGFLFIHLLYLYF